ncbi:ATL1 [Bugula neritina]|uniref:ATL1 n=1 Tax=Bugula neritina TaxID=10212 RepID=A0A7J7K882_BUGNE|nr:ATL1 [Bugula neritina]
MGSGASSQGMIRPDHSSLLIRFPNKKDIGEGDIPIFRVQELEALINADEAIREKKFFLVSITGVYRSGKSFLLNLMQTYLDYYQKNGSDTNWEKTKMKIEGGKWKQSTESVTHGIWIWNKGFLINDIVIVLVDCQGTGDSLMSTPTLDNLILYLGLQLANVQILNLKSVLQTNDLERIYMCQHFSDLHLEDSLFNCSLLYLLRDYNGDNEYGRKDFLFTRITDDSKSEVAKNFASGIEKTFLEIATFAVPGPGSKSIYYNKQETKIKVQAKHDEFETRVRHDQEQRASCEQEIEKLKIVLSEKEKLATEDRRERQEIAKRHEEKLKSLQDQLNQKMISQQQFEDMRLKIESLEKEEKESKNRETAELKRQLELKELQELKPKTFSDDETTWVEDVAEGAKKLTYGAARGVGSAVAATAKNAHDGVITLFGGLKKLFS